MRSIFKDYKFIISVIIGILGIIGLDHLLKLSNSTMCFIPAVNSFINEYSGILLLAVVALIFNTERKQSLILKKLGMLTPETITIISDSSTKFMGSNAYKNLLTNTNAVPARIHELWRRADRQFPLRDAIWIADRNTISNEEAIKGGDYAFQREFEISFELTHLRLAEIYILVDDVCELVVNGTRFEKVSGFLEECHRFDITKNIIKGTNRLQFVIENVNAETFPENIQTATMKNLLNPYGFKYLLLIKYLK